MRVLSTPIWLFLIRSIYCHEQSSFSLAPDTFGQWPISWDDSANTACPFPSDVRKANAQPFSLGWELCARQLTSRISTFAHTEYLQCFGKDKHETFDIAFPGLPFDTLASYRPGARFGPDGIRRGSQRMAGHAGYGIQSRVLPIHSTF